MLSKRSPLNGSDNSSSRPPKRTSNEAFKCDTLKTDRRPARRSYLCVAVALVSLLGWIAYPSNRHLRQNELLDAPIKKGIQTALRASRNAPCPEDQMVTKRIVVIGAGAAGMTAAKRLIEAPSWMPKSACWKPEVTVLEASHRIGGRVGKDTEFTNYPIDLGASWISDVGRLQFIAQDPKIVSKVKQHFGSIFEAEEYIGFLIDEHGEMDKAGFKNPRRYDMLWNNFTWFDFLEQYVASAIPQGQLFLNCPVKRIEFRKEEGDVMISACQGRTIMADHVILTSSLAVLQDEVIEFQPHLPTWILEGRKPMWKGFKFFLEFKRKFYPDYVYFSFKGGEHDWWDYSKIQDVDPIQNIVSGYYMGSANRKFQSLNEEEIVQEILHDLDKFPGMEGLASKNYKRHKLIHYGRDFPYIRGTYSEDCAPYPEVGPQEVFASRRLLLAGEAFPVPRCQVGWVDGAALSGLHAAELILNHIDATVDWFSIPAALKYSKKEL